MRFNGERLGTGDGPVLDIAVDPVEGTRLLAQGRQGSVATVALAVLICVTARGGADEPQIDPAANMLLKRMGAVLAAAEEFTLTNTFTSDETVSTGEIVQLEGTVEIALRRPDGLRASIHGDFGSKQYFYDGSTMVFADRSPNTYAHAIVSSTPARATAYM